MNTVIAIIEVVFTLAFLYGLACIVKPFWLIKKRWLGLALTIGSMFVTVWLGSIQQASSSKITQEAVVSQTSKPEHTDDKGQPPAAPIDYSALYVGRRPPRGALAKLRKAARLAASQANCDHVTGGGYLTPRERDPHHLSAPYFVTCSDPSKAIDPGARNFYFTNADLRAGRVEHHSVPVQRDQALGLCLNAIRQKLQYPSSAKFDPWRTKANLGGTLNWRVVIPFTALNGFGKRVPSTGLCIVDPYKHVDVSIKSR